MQDSAQKTREYVRTVIDPKIMSPYTSDKILIPICDNGWSPTFRRGEFAVVDTSNCQLEDGTLICIRQERGRYSMTELKLWEEKKKGRITSERKYERPFWYMLYGKQRMQGWTDEGAPTFIGDPIRMADGPVDSKIMRSMMVGRILGVMGSAPHAINWGL